MASADSVIALLIGFWVTEKQLHSIDTTTVTIVGLAILFLPKIGVMNWPQVQKLVPWGTIIVFGVGISLGTALLDTKAEGADGIAPPRRRPG